MFMIANIDASLYVMDRSITVRAWPTVGRRQCCRPCKITVTTVQAQLALQLERTFLVMHDEGSCYLETFPEAHVSVSAQKQEADLQETWFLILCDHVGREFPVIVKYVTEVIQCEATNSATGCRAFTDLSQRLEVAKTVLGVDPSSRLSLEDQI